MKKVMSIILVLICNQAFGLNLMGPPKATLEQGQNSFGFGYSNSDVEIELSGYGDKWTEDVETNSLLGTFGYGIVNNCEVFVRLGFTDVEAEVLDVLDFDSDFEFSYGFGAKVTFAEYDALSLGSIFQIHWFEGDDDIYGIKQEFDAYEIQIAVGPTYKYNNISIYGGPFLHFINGDYDIEIPGIISASADIEEESVFGGYIGLDAALSENADWRIEFQLTDDAQAFCTGLRLKF